MMTKKLVNAVNEQIKHEIESAYLYLSMSAWCESRNYPGFAKWLRTQWQEELAHALKLFDMVNDRGGRVMLQAIAQPAVDFKSPLDVFEKVQAHEQKVSALINGLYAAAVKEDDYAAQAALQWFVSEQVEEEKTAGEIVAALKMIGDSGTSLFMLDRQLGSRGS